ncbi:MAG: hypothetical protein JO309_01550 [Pseudonocardiales bacterium]|nr:hypothetical protein [Hyphomicrobiales bacterium]MBV8825506.1 hypothetical protein [Hyphomicrobiales bacterium]MBV9429432.1 hypothetical protein [Bradyrhizobiaceae bacterium]MBV9728100.1 hypothetical protein [Pseudonocardiales bacterium]
MFELESAIYRRTEPWAALARQGKDAVARELGELLGRQIEKAVGNIPADQVGLNMVVSTMLDMPFTSGWITWPEIADNARQHTRCPPENFVTAYECASWGYVLRYAKSCKLAAPYVVVTILDLNVFDLSYWRASPMWGHSGFGVATVVLRCSTDDFIYCQTSKSSNAFGEFCFDLRNVMAKDATLLACPPFFPPNIAVLYDRLLPTERLLPNRNADYGHSFGADPWIALIEQRRAGLDRPGDVFLATSIALSGYWCFAEVRLHPAGQFILEDTLPAPMGVAA